MILVLSWFKILTFDLSIFKLFRIKCGKMEYYDKSYDRVTTKNEKKLKRIDRIFHKVTTTDDPIIRQVNNTVGIIKYMA